jgi:hypothetical protein
MNSPNKLESQLGKLDLNTLTAIALLTSERRKFTTASTGISTVLALVAGVASAAAGLFPRASTEVIAVTAIVFGVITYFLALRERRKEEEVVLEKLLKEIEKSISNREDAAATEREILMIIRNISKGDA